MTHFLIDRRQQVRLEKFISSIQIISTGTPRQGCVLSPLLFSIYTNDCTSGDPSFKLMNFTDNTTVICLRVRSLHTDKRLNNWPYGVVTTTWCCICSKLCRYFYIDNCQEGPAEDALPVPTQDVQPASGAVNPILLCNNIVCSLHIHRCLA